MSHRIAFHCALVSGTILVALAEHRGIALIYAVGLAAMFGTSATLHRADWRPAVFNWLRRADHSTIFICIATTYTPLALLGLGGQAGERLALLAYIVCGLGVVRAVAWPHAPRVVTSACFVAAGWIVLAYLPAFHAALDPNTFFWIFAGGSLFTIGAVIYMIKRPDPWPLTFGYHEVFHLFVVVASACQFVAVARLTGAV